MKKLSKQFTKWIALLLVIAQIAVIPAYAADTADGSQPSTEAGVTTAPASSSAPAETTGTTETTTPAPTPTATQPEPSQSLAATEPQETAPEETVPAPAEKAVTLPEVPQYYQNDYANIGYPGGTIASHGSGITALAMTASCLTDHEFTPQLLAKYFGKVQGRETARLEYAFTEMQLPWSKAGSWQDTLEALKEGSIVIASMNEMSVFTSTQHYIILAGLNEEGNVIVKDPNKNNVSKKELKDGFATGFPQGWIATGFAGGWIFDVSAMPQDPFIYTVEEKTIDEMPIYYQNDYPDVRYGSGTIASSGCSITSLAMVASYMTGHQYTPDELADYFGGYTGNNVERLEYASSQLRLPWRQAYNWHEAEAALDEGNLVIVLENGKSKFTTSQHFIILTGLTPDRRVMVVDSERKNYDKWDLKDGYQNGFSIKQICSGWAGAWIYDVNSMPANPFIYQEAPLPYVEPRYPEINLTAAEMDLLARMVWVEARGEPFDGQQAVAEVVLNRVVSEDFASSVTNVIYSGGQFRSTLFLDEAEPTQTQYEAVEQALYGPYVLPIDVVHFAQFPVNDRVWGWIGGHVFCYQWGEGE